MGSGAHSRGQFHRCHESVTCSNIKRHTCTHLIKSERKFIKAWGMRFTNKFFFFFFFFFFFTVCVTSWCGQGGDGVALGSNLGHIHICLTNIKICYLSAKNNYFNLLECRIRVSRNVSITELRLSMV